MDSRISGLLDKLQLSGVDSLTTDAHTAVSAASTDRQCCDRCQQFISAMHRSVNETETSESDDGATHSAQYPCIHYLADDLEHSVRSGCPTCLVFIEAALRYFRPAATHTHPTKGGSALESILVELERSGEGPRPFSILLRCFVVGGNSRAGKDVAMYAPEGFKSDLCSWPLAQPPFRTTAEAKLARGHQWLRDCEENHTGCRLGDHSSGEGMTPLPKRVLDVSSPDGVIRLWEPPVTSTGQYVCLSHCWGVSQPLTTTRSALEERKRAIPWETIPQTFQDAISVTRKLGVRFLWIDSLCIIQDDRRDWAEQAPAMCDIYRKALLTIAATRCEGCHDSFFPSLDRHVRGTDELGNPLEAVLAVRCPHLYHWGSGAGYAFLERAWIFQERLLSRRVLHFGFDEVFWECMELTDCQCPSEDQYHPELAIKSVGYRHPVSDATQPTSRSQTLIWHEMVMFYTALKLTYASDRHAAILGLAREMEPYRKGSYVAGLWQDSLIADLAWTVTKWTDKTDRSRPTWSWVSSNHTIWYSPRWVDGDVEVLAVEPPSQPLGAPSIPGINDKRALGSITLRGRVFSGVSNNKRTRKRDYRGRSPPPEHEWLARSFGRTFDNDSRKRAFFDPDLPFSVAPFLPDGETVLCLAIGFDGTHTQDFDVGLILRCADEKSQLYERLGIVKIEGGGSNPEKRRRRGGFDQFRDPTIRTVTII